MTFLCVIYNGKSKKSYRRMFQEVRFHIDADDISKSVADGFNRFRFFCLYNLLCNANVNTTTRSIILYLIKAKRELNQNNKHSQ